MIFIGGGKDRLGSTMFRHVGAVRGFRTAYRNHSMLKALVTSHQFIGYATTKPASIAMLMTNQNAGANGLNLPPTSIRPRDAIGIIPVITRFIERNSGKKMFASDLR
jgi:hypothetical protein